MEIIEGNVYEITYETKNGTREKRGIYLGGNKNKKLFLLLLYVFPNCSLKLKTVQIGEHRQLAYSPPGRGNLISGKEIRVKRQIGRLSSRDLDQVYCDIYSTNLSWMLERLASEDSPMKGFWSTFTMPSGMKVYGGNTRKL